MTVFSLIVARVPSRVIDIPVDAWADGWDEKPAVAVKAGLRLLSEEDLQTARANATDKAIEAQQDRVGRIEAFNDHLMAWAVARSLCTPEDATQPYFGSPHENVLEAFTSRGIQRIWEEIEVLHAERSPLTEEATDQDLDALAARLNRETFREIPSDKQGRVRRLVTFLLAEIHG